MFQILFKNCFKMLFSCILEQIFRCFVREINFSIQKILDWISSNLPPRRACSNTVHVAGYVSCDMLHVTWKDHSKIYKKYISLLLFVSLLVIKRSYVSQVIGGQGVLWFVGPFIEINCPWSIDMFIRNLKIPIQTWIRTF